MGIGVKISRNIQYDIVPSISQTTGYTMLVMLEVEHAFDVGIAVGRLQP
jgi:hypothetical protein